MPDVALDLSAIINGAANDATPVRAALTALQNAINGLDGDNLTDATAEKLGLSSTSGVRRGKAIITGAESRTNAAYGLLTTPDRVQNVVLPTDGLIFVMYRAQWKESVAGAARAALFLGGNQVKVPFADPDGLYTWEASHEAGNVWAPLLSTGVGLIGRGAGDSPASPISFPTTGLTLGFFGGSSGTSGIPEGIGGLWVIEAAAGTYDVSVQFKASSGSVTVQDRKLRVWTQGF